MGSNETKKTTELCNGIVNWSCLDNLDVTFIILDRKVGGGGSVTLIRVTKSMQGMPGIANLGHIRRLLFLRQSCQHET